MPELPDVEGHRRYFARHARGRPVSTVSVPQHAQLGGMWLAPSAGVIEGITGKLGPDALDVDGEAFARRPDARRAGWAGVASSRPPRDHRVESPWPDTAIGRRSAPPSAFARLVVGYQAGVTNLIQRTGRKLWSSVRGGPGIGDRIRDDVIEPIGEGLRASGEAAADRIRRSNGHARLTAPVLVVAGVAGAVGEYFLDPQSGRRRRAVARDRIAAFLRRRKADAERQTRYAGVAKGAAERTTPLGRHPDELNDPALEAKVESEIFRDSDAPKGKVSVSVEEGVVYLRGELRTKKAIEELARSARAVEGVGEVVNMLHRPGEEAAAKQDGHGRGDAKRPSGKARGKAKRQAPARSK